MRYCQTSFMMRLQGIQSEPQPTRIHAHSPAIEAVLCVAGVCRRVWGFVEHFGEADGKTNLRTLLIHADM